jgi:hypothetical protein
MVIKLSQISNVLILRVITAMNGKPQTFPKMANSAKQSHLLEVK